MEERYVWSFKVKQILINGRVPVEVIHELRHMDPNGSAAFQPALALSQTVDKLGHLDTEGWILIMRLINSSKFYNHSVRDAMLKRFSPSNRSCCPDATEARAAVLTTLLNMGYRFYPVDLVEEVDIKNEMPELWRTTWKRCGIEEYLPAA